MLVVRQSAIGTLLDRSNSDDIINVFGLGFVDCGELVELTE